MILLKLEKIFLKFLLIKFGGQKGQILPFFSSFPIFFFYEKNSIWAIFDPFDPFSFFILYTIISFNIYSFPFNTTKIIIIIIILNNNNNNNFNNN